MVSMMVSQNWFRWWLHDIWNKTIIIWKKSFHFVHLTHKHRETHGCVVSTVATDALVLKHQAITIQNAD